MQKTNRWNRELGDITNDELKTFNLNLKFINEIKLRDFQFKINNKILVTNYFLHKIIKIDNDLCSSRIARKRLNVICICCLVVMRSKGFGHRQP